jgi:uncharacterized membrane protein
MDIKHFKNMKKILANFMVLSFLLSFALIANAASTTGHSESSSFWPLLQCGNAGQPECDLTEAVITINRVINWFISISISVMAITFSVAGARILLHPDQAGEREKAKEMFRKTIIGMFIVLCAWLIIHKAVSVLVSNPTSALRFLGK